MPAGNQQLAIAQERVAAAKYIMFYIVSMPVE